MIQQTPQTIQQTPQTSAWCEIRSWILVVITSLCCSSISYAQLDTNQAVPIFGRVQVQPVIVSDDDGTNESEYFGTDSSIDEVLGTIDTIWAQVGIDFEFFSPIRWSNSDANSGTLSANQTRPNSELFTLRQDADAAGILDSNDSIIDLFLVEVVPGFTVQPETTINGLGFTGVVALHIGDTLPGRPEGRRAIGIITAHELGHGLGLGHPDPAFDPPELLARNLMLEAGSPNPGERLTNLQLDAILERESIAGTFGFPQYIVPVPEPATGGLLGLITLIAVSRYRSRARI